MTTLSLILSIIAIDLWAVYAVKTYLSNDTDVFSPLINIAVLGSAWLLISTIASIVFLFMHISIHLV